MLNTQTGCPVWGAWRCQGPGLWGHCLPAGARDRSGSCDFVTLHWLSWHGVSCTCQATKRSPCLCSQDELAGWPPTSGTSELTPPTGCLLGLPNPSERTGIGDPPLPVEPPSLTLACTRSPLPPPPAFPGVAPSHPSPSAVSMGISASKCESQHRPLSPDKADSGTCPSLGRGWGAPGPQKEKPIWKVSP